MNQFLNKPIAQSKGKQINESKNNHQQLKFTLK